VDAAITSTLTAVAIAYAPITFMGCTGTVTP
jgi:hypothetical protein